MKLVGRRTFLAYLQKSDNGKYVELMESLVLENSAISHQ